MTTKEKLLVHVVGGDNLVSRMFAQRQFDVTDKFHEDVDLACFTGGEDVTPFLYGEEPIKLNNQNIVHFNPDRDMREIRLFHKYIDLDIPMVGICRGGQLLNVLNGGRMWQHVNNHTATHDMEYVSGYRDEKNGKNTKRVTLWSKVSVTSTHHQQMRMGGHGFLLGRAGLSTHKYNQDGEIIIANAENKMVDNEIIYYWPSRVLCFQPHPEYGAKNSDTQRIFFEIMNRELISLPIIHRSI